MKRYIAFAALGVLVLVVAVACAPAGGGTETKPADHVISVTGEGKVQVKPDIAVATLGVETHNAEVGPAVDENIANAQAIMDALKAAGVAEKDIQTANFSVYSQEQFDVSGRPTGERTYVVTNTVAFTVRDIPQLGKILGAALKAGANSVGGVTFDVEDPSAPMSEARAKAMADARARAEVLAKAAGVTLGAPTSISESVGVPVVNLQMEKAPSAMGGGGGNVPVSAGMLSVTDSVSVTYLIK
jgi:uncharacterized protein YggE